MSGSRVRRRLRRSADGSVGALVHIDWLDAAPGLPPTLNAARRDDVDAGGPVGDAGRWRIGPQFSVAIAPPGEDCIRRKRRVRLERLSRTYHAVNISCIHQGDLPVAVPHVQERDALPTAVLRLGDLLGDAVPETWTRTTRFPMARKHSAEHEESCDETEDQGQTDKRPRVAAGPRLAAQMWARIVRCAHQLGSYAWAGPPETESSATAPSAEPANVRTCQREFE